MSDRKIIHIDMDCFYAAVEMRDNPELRGIPIAIGSTSRRSVLCTSNYEARKYGVRAAMPTAIALRKCPHLKVVPGRMSKYKEISEQIREIFYSFTDLVEPLSLDEAYLDVTDCTQFKGSATLIANEIRRQIYEKTQLTASAGVSINKMIAKVASDWNKPNGTFVVPPNMVEGFVKDLPVKKISGIGKVTAKFLEELGITTCYDIQQKGEDFLRIHLKNRGAELYQKSFGIDHREVSPSRIRKSLSLERTYEYDLSAKHDIENELPSMLEELEYRFTKWMNKEESPLPPSKVFIKVRFNDFSTFTVEKSQPLSFFKELLENGKLSVELKSFFHDLLDVGLSRKNLPIRLLGMGIRFNDKFEQTEQLSLNF